jgi:hypothetical protein
MTAIDAMQQALTLMKRSPSNGDLVKEVNG